METEDGERGLGTGMMEKRIKVTLRAGDTPAKLNSKHLVQRFGV